MALFKPKKRTILQFVTRIEGESPIWLTIYSDLMTNLMLFFLMLFAVTRLSVEQKAKVFDDIESKFEKVAAEMSGTGTGEDGEGEGEAEDGDGGKGGGKGGGEGAKEGKGKGGGEGDGVGEGEDSAGEITSQDEEDIAREMQEKLKNKSMENDVEIKINEQKIRMVLSSPVLFGAGQAELKPSSHKILHEVATLVKSLPQRIVVEGHTDNIPIHNEEFQSNWELSSARAFSVVKYFIEKENMNPERLAGLGYGEYRPLYENDTAEHRAQNRRVEVNVIRVRSK